MIGIVEVKGTVTDLYNKTVPQAKIVWSDKDGNAVKGADGNTLGVIADNDGKYSIKIPTLNNIPASPYITASMMGMPKETINFVTSMRDIGTADFILGAKTQEEDEVVVVGKCDFKCKARRHWRKHKKAYIIGIISLVLLAVILTVVFATKKNGK